MTHNLLSSAAEERWRRGKAWVRWANQRRYTQKTQHKYQNGWIFLILPRNYTKVKLIVESLWWWQPNCKQGLKAEIHFYQQARKAQSASREKGQDSGGACATHMRSAWHSNTILLSANTWVVWGWRDNVDGEHCRTSVCVNKIQSVCHQLLKKDEDGAKLE